MGETPIKVAFAQSWVATLGAAVWFGMVAAPYAATEPQLCMFIVGDEDLSELPKRCKVGDVLTGVVGAPQGSWVGYVGRICDFEQEIVWYPHPDPGSGQNVFACVFTGRVLGSTDKVVGR
jgi:hypothetical protein